MSNKRQFALAWQLYADDHAGTYPPQDGTGGGWVNGWLTPDANNPDNTYSLHLREGKLWSYVTGEQLYRCPGDRSQAVFGGIRFPRVRSYSGNAWIFSGQRSWTLHLTRSSVGTLVSPLNPSSGRCQSGNAA